MTTRTNPPPRRLPCDRLRANGGVDAPDLAAPVPFVLSLSRHGWEELTCLIDAALRQAQGERSIGGACSCLTQSVRAELVEA